MYLYKICIFVYWTPFSVDRYILEKLRSRSPKSIGWSPLLYGKQRKIGQCDCREKSFMVQVVYKIYTYAAQVWKFIIMYNKYRIYKYNKYNIYATGYNGMTALCQLCLYTNIIYISIYNIVLMLYLYAFS